jgi:hypothetical protein
MVKYTKGEFYPKNLYKYIKKSKLPIIYKSSWELYFMNFLDQNQNIIEWGYEVLKIPYYNPFKKKFNNYYPDFLIKYFDKDKNINVELIEIKPIKEANLKESKTKNDKLKFILNMYKWRAADNWCKKRNIKFRIISEKDMFHNGL